MGHFQIQTVGAKNEKAKEKSLHGLPRKSKVESGALDIRIALIKGKEDIPREKRRRALIK